jgi:hypothetical protein
VEFDWGGSERREGRWAERLAARCAVMTEFLATPTASIVLALAGLAVLVAIGLYLIGKVRGELNAETEGANEHLSKFRDLHYQGGLSEEEYRTIKSVLAEPLKQQLAVDPETKPEADAKED